MSDPQRGLCVVIALYAVGVCTCVCVKEGMRKRVNSDVIMSSCTRLPTQAPLASNHAVPSVGVSGHVGVAGWLCSGWACVLTLMFILPRRCPI